MESGCGISVVRKETLWRASSPIHLEGEILRRAWERLKVGERGGSLDGLLVVG